MAELARNFERLLAVCERILRTAEHPESQRFPGQGCRADVLAETRGQRTMLVRIVERDRVLEMRARLFDVPGVQQGQAHEAMTHHAGSRRPLLVCKLQELVGKLAHHVTL